MKFAQTARLRLFITVAACLIPYFYRQTVVVKRVLHHGARSARSAFRAKRDGAAALIAEGVHFFLDYIGSIADRAKKQLGMLKNRRADLMKAVM